uniref:GAG-pre-integrase domain-containing protein n=1 Tax=Triticum urartu TaxID=4572 RepID=A0A8R7PP50_TRIUA
MKDLHTRAVILRCNIHGDLYVFPSSVINHHAHGLIATTSTELWHRCLGHPGHDAMSHLHKQSYIPCNKPASHVFHACQLGKHVRLPFTSSTSHCVEPFQLVHCDLWTSPVLSNSGFKYYLVIVDDFSHYIWTLPLSNKSDTAATLINFVAYARTQFSCPLVAM